MYYCIWSAMEGYFKVQNHLGKEISLDRKFRIKRMAIYRIRRTIWLRVCKVRLRSICNFT